MLQDGTVVKITDNGGGKIGKIFKVLGGSRKRYASIGDIVVLSVKVAEPRKAIKKKDVVLNATNTFVYGNQNGTLTNRDFSSSLNFNLYKTLPNFYYWGLLNYNTSYSLKINNQFLGGLGVAYNFLDSKNSYLNLSDGILYDKSNLLANLDYNTFRNSFRLAFRFSFNDVVIVDGNNFLQSSLSNGNDYIIKSNTSISFKLRKWISLTTALNYNRMNITQRENLLLTYGVTIDKFF